MKKRFPISNLDCAHCALKMETAIKELEGVNNASVNIMTQKLTLDAEDSCFDSILEKALAICKKVEPDCEIHV